MPICTCCCVSIEFLPHLGHKRLQLFLSLTHKSKRDLKHNLWRHLDKVKGHICISRRKRMEEEEEGGEEGGGGRREEEVEAEKEKCAWGVAFGTAAVIFTCWCANSPISLKGSGHLYTSVVFHHMGNPIKMATNRMASAEMY